MTFSFDALRRSPDVEGPGLVAVDAADRLILDESADARAGAHPARIVVIGDTHGALTLGAADAGARGIRVHQDALSGERALERNAEGVGLVGTFTRMPLSPELVRDAEVVLLRLPRSLDALADQAGLIAHYAAPGVRVFAGGRLKHMSRSMNEVLGRRFGVVEASLARQKSRVLRASAPREGADPVPARAEIDGLVVCAFGGAFAGATIDIGTRLLLAHLPEQMPNHGVVIDFACGTGVVAAELARRHPELSVIATDQSAVAVASARATAEANGVSARVHVVRDDLLSAQPDGSAEMIALNPPFHSDAAVTSTLAPRFFREAGRVLRPGGELWTVWNSPLNYRGALERAVGPTRQVARNAKFTVTVSVAR